MPDCSIRNWAMKRGWREQWTTVQSEASAFLHSCSVQFFWCLVLPSIHSTSYPTILYTTLKKKVTKLNYFCKWLHCCIFPFSLDLLYIWYLVCLSFVTHCLDFEVFLRFSFCPDCIYCCVSWLAASFAAGFSLMWGDSKTCFWHPKPFMKSLWKLMWLWNMRDWPEINSVWIQSGIHVLSSVAHLNYDINSNIFLGQV